VNISLHVKCQKLKKDYQREGKKKKKAKLKGKEGQLHRKFAIGKKIPNQAHKQPSQK
jgi:hypothetical protein